LEQFINSSYRTRISPSHRSARCRCCCCCCCCCLFSLVTSRQKPPTVTVTRPGESPLLD